MVVVSWKEVERGSLREREARDFAGPGPFLVFFKFFSPLKPSSFFQDSTYGNEEFWPSVASYPVGVSKTSLVLELQTSLL